MRLKSLRLNSQHLRPISKCQFLKKKSCSLENLCFADGDSSIGRRFPAVLRQLSLILTRYVPILIIFTLSVYFQLISSSCIQFMLIGDCLEFEVCRSVFNLVLQSLLML